jgi:hypothetical protein
MFLTSSASADQTLPEIVVYGHRQMPSVVIELTRPTAAHEAGAAHEAFRREMLEKSRPPALTK